MISEKLQQIYEMLPIQVWAAIGVFMLLIVVFLLLRRLKILSITPASDENNIPSDRGLEPQKNDFAKIVNAVRVLGSISQEGVECIRAVWNQWLKLGDGDLRKLAYIYATIKKENGKFGKPIREKWGPTSDQQNYSYKLGNNGPADGYKFRGGGFVQTTGKKNYEKYKNLLGIDLVSNPELLLQGYDYSAFATVHGMMTGNYTGKKLSDYINGSNADYYNARRTVNGIVPSVAREIAENAAKIYAKMN